MHTLTIQSITKQHSIPDATDYLDVAFAINDTIQNDESEEDVVTVFEGRHGFPLDTPEDEIKESLQAFLTTYLEDQARSITNAKVEELHKQADETIANLEGLEINAEINQ